MTRRGLRRALRHFLHAALPGLGLLGLVQGVQADDNQRNAKLREEVQRIAVGDSGATIVITSYRPFGNGPFPWIILSHGSAVTPEANRALGRNRNVALAQEWVQRGYAVLAPIRRGYGDSGGARFGDDRGSCDKPDYQGAGEGGALDLQASLTWARTQRDLDPSHWMLVGQSAGGFASIYTASQRPQGLRAVLAFSPGRGGDPDKRPGVPCAPERMARVIKDAAAKITVPVLWFYAENDAYMGAPVRQMWFDAFKAGGGQGELVIVPAFAQNRGHGVFPAKAGVPLWTAATQRFLKAYKVDMPF